MHWLCVSSERVTSTKGGSETLFVCLFGIKVTRKKTASNTNAKQLLKVSHFSKGSLSSLATTMLGRVGALDLMHQEHSPNSQGIVREKEKRRKWKGRASAVLPPWPVVLSYCHLTWLDIRLRKVTYCLGCAAIFLAVVAVAVLATALANCPVLFLR